MTSKESTPTVESSALTRRSMRLLKGKKRSTENSWWDVRTFGRIFNTKQKETVLSKILKTLQDISLNIDDATTNEKNRFIDLYTVVKEMKKMEQIMKRIFVSFKHQWTNIAINLNEKFCGYTYEGGITFISGVNYSQEQLESKHAQFKKDWSIFSALKAK